MTRTRFLCLSALQKGLFLIPEGDSDLKNHKGKDKRDKTQTKIYLIMAHVSIELGLSILCHWFSRRILFCRLCLGNLKTKFKPSNDMLLLLSCRIIYHWKLGFLAINFSPTIYIYCVSFSPKKPLQYYAVTISTNIYTCCIEYHNMMQSCWNTPFKFSRFCTYQLFNNFTTSDILPTILPSMSIFSLFMLH